MKKGNTAILVLLVLSLWMNFKTGSEVRQIRNELNNLNHSISNQINAISSNVYNAAKAMEEKAKWVREASFELIRANDDYSAFGAVLDFTLNERRKGEELNVFLISDEDGSRVKIPVPESDGLSRQVMLELDKKDYVLEIMGSGEAGSRSEKLTAIPLRNAVDNRITIDGQIPSQKFSYNPDIGTINFYVNVAAVHKKTFPGMDILIDGDLAFSEIVADLYVGENRVDTIDLMEGKGYEEKDISDITNAIPEFAGGVETLRFAGTYIFEGPRCTEYLELKNSDNYGRDSLFFLIRATDLKGNEYRQIIPEHFYYLDGDEIKSRM